MAYCVRCGVELKSSDPKCPLCGTPVNDPDQFRPDPLDSPCPQGQPARRINRRYGAQLATMILLIPMAVVLTCDLLISGRISWSPYVLGACGCLFFWVILPFYFGPAKPYPYVAIDVAAATLYMALIGYMSGEMRWYVQLALPLSLLVGTATGLSIYAFRRRQTQMLDRLSYAVFLCAAMLLGMEAIIDHYIRAAVHFQWSVYALLPLVALGTCFRIIERNQRLKEIIHKRLYL